MQTNLPSPNPLDTSRTDSPPPERVNLLENKSKFVQHFAEQAAEDASQTSTPMQMPKPPATTAPAAHCEVARKDAGFLGAIANCFTSPLSVTSRGIAMSVRFIQRMGQAIVDMWAHETTADFEMMLLNTVQGLQVRQQMLEIGHSAHASASLHCITKHDAMPYI